MLNLDEQREFDALRQHVECSKKLACVRSSIEDVCAGKYYRETDFLQCLNCRKAPCKFNGAIGCACPLRRFIARNFDRWSAANTSMLR